MLGLLAPILAGGGPAVPGGALSSGDVSLLREAERLMPQGLLTAGGPLVLPDGRPGRGWEIGHDASSGSSGAPTGSRAASQVSPAARRTAEAVLAEMHRYFEDHRTPLPNARTVLGGRIMSWALALQEHEPALEVVGWWCEFLRRIEDSRPFTRSNWAVASAFEVALSRSRLALLDLRRQMEVTALASGLQDLREALEALHRDGRDAADKLFELLHVALRPQAASERICFHELERRARAHHCGAAVEEQVMSRILEFEEAGVADALAPVFLGKDGTAAAACAGDALARRGGASAVEASSLFPAEVLAKLEDAAVLVRELQDHLLRGKGEVRTAIEPGVVRALGHGSLAAFVELHGLYCHLATLLQRFELLLRTVRDYARFICFLPLHRVSVLEIEVILPRLRQRLVAGVRTISSTYESLSWGEAPRGRGAVVEKCQCLLSKLEHCGSSSSSALTALKACTPESTLNEFEGWRGGDERWLKVARMQLSASSLLSAQELKAFEVPQLAECLAISGKEETLAPVLPAGTEAARHGGALEPWSRSSSPGGRGQLALKSLVDEDTRLYEAGRSVGILGQRIHAAAAPRCAQAAACTAQASVVVGTWLQSAIRTQVGDGEGMLGRDTADAAARATQLVRDFLGPQPPPLGRHFHTISGADDWLLVNPESEAACEERAAGGRDSNALLALQGPPSPGRHD